MPNFTDNVSFDTIAREWRCKWSDDNDKASLEALQELLEANLEAIKKVEGVEVQRVNCGQRKYFKIYLSQYLIHI